MAAAGAVDVKAVRVGELLRVTVGGGQPKDQVLAALDLVPADLQVGRGDAAGELERGVVVQDLLYAAARQAWVLA